MSALEDLTNSLKARFEQLATRIQESDTYQKLAERYQGLTPQGQRLATIVVIVSISVLVLFSPMTTYFSSEEQISMFETQRDLIKDLFKTYREANKDAGVSMPPPADMLISQITGQLQSNQLLPEQIVGVSRGSFEGRLIPEKFVRDIVHVNLAKLNLRQIVDIGNVLNRLSESVKMKDLVITARTDINGYFDVTYKMYALNIPETQISPIAEIEEPSSGSKRRNKDNSESSSGSADE